MFVLACGDEPTPLTAHDSGAPVAPAADQALPVSKGPLSLKLEHVDIREHGYQGTSTVYEITTAKVLICSKGLACKKPCSTPLGEDNYQELVKAVQTSGFMTSAKKKDHCVDDMGYERMTVKLTAAGKTQTAVYEGQTVSCLFKIDPTAKAVYQALGEAVQKALLKSSCNK